MQVQKEILDRVAALLAGTKDIFTNQERFEEHLFRSGLTPEVENRPDRPKVFKH